MKFKYVGSLAGVAVLATLFAVAGCSSPTSSSSSTPAPAYTTALYMTDSTNGLVYTFDPTTGKGSASSLVKTSSKAAGEIKFYKGIGYVAMGNGGIYTFDPSAAVPSTQSIPGSLGVDAQYFAFVSSSRAYVSVGTTLSSNTGGLYTFNPSNLSAGLTQLTGSNEGLYLQELIVGPDNNIYAAAYGSQEVLEISPSTNAVIATYPAGAAGTTGLVSGTYNGDTGIFVANAGGYGPGPSYTPIPGSVDFLDLTKATYLKNIVPSTGALPIYPGRLIQLPNGNLVATGSSGTYLITFAGSIATVKTLAAGGTTFGSFSVAYNASNGLVYVPYNVYGTSSQLFVFDVNGNQQPYSPVSVMQSTDNIANVAFYQN